MVSHNDLHGSNPQLVGTDEINRSKKRVAVRPHTESGDTAQVAPAAPPTTPTMFQQPTSKILVLWQQAASLSTPTALTQHPPQRQHSYDISRHPQQH